MQLHVSLHSTTQNELDPIQVLPEGTMNYKYKNSFRTILNGTIHQTLSKKFLNFVNP